MGGKPTDFPESPNRRIALTSVDDSMGFLRGAENVEWQLEAVDDDELGLSLVPNASPWLEIRLLYVRISPCCADLAPERLSFHTVPRPMGAVLEINGSRIPPSNSATLALRRDRLDRGSGEVTYVSTEGVRVAGALGFEVTEDAVGDLILCGSLERVEALWDSPGVEKDGRTGWSMDCYSAVAPPRASTAFLRSGTTTAMPSMEVYVAGCSSGHPLILTKTIPLGSRRKALRTSTLESIPEDEESGLQQNGSVGSLHRRTLQIPREKMDAYGLEDKAGHSFYMGDGYSEDDGQLSWFNAGVRVGVGIGLGMCLGVGIGVGLLMRSYQTTTRSLKRRFF